MRTRIENFHVEAGEVDHADRVATLHVAGALARVEDEAAVRGRSTV